MPQLSDVYSTIPFRSIFNYTLENNILLMNADGIILTVNPAFTGNFGYQPEELRGKHASVLFTKEDQNKGLPQKEINSVLNTGQGADNNYLVSKYKKITWVSGESVLVKRKNGKACIVKIIQNIHLQKTTEISLQHLYDFNEDILSSIQDVVIVLNKEMKVIKANSAFTKLFKNNISGPEAVDFSTLITQYEGGDALLDNIQNTFSTGRDFLKIPLEIKTGKGENKIYNVNCNSMQYNNSGNNILLVLQDVTSQKQLERGREDIFGLVAHELRNPLANLGLSIEVISMLINQNRLAEIPDMLQKNKNNLVRLNKMIAELYNATKVNAGDMNLDIAPYNFKEMIEEAIETVKALQPAYNITVTGNGDYIVSGDRYRMIQVVTNYLTNGIKYSNGNTTVLLTVKRDSKSITVSVQDHGLGISSGQLPLLFERFFRAEQTRSIEGLGLGLYICRRIIQAHHGKVWVESEENKGSTFYFSIPL